jgi:hypothetical protein
MAEDLLGCTDEWLCNMTDFLRSEPKWHFIRLLGVGHKAPGRSLLADAMIARNAASLSVQEIFYLPNYDKAWDMLQNDVLLENSRKLKRYLKEIRVSNSTDLGRCTEDQLREIAKNFKNIPRRVFLKCLVLSS